MTIYIDRLEALMGELTHNEFFTKQFLEETERLPRTEGSLIVTELDETLFSRSQMRENEELLKNNPEDAMNKLVKFQLGIPYIIAKYYEGQQGPEDIKKLITSNNAVIMTVGFEDIQQAKLAALQLQDIPLVVLKDKQEKIIALMQYILYSVRYIPNEIIIYEDEPQYFIEYRELIEGILSCKVTIMHVQMENNSGYTKIEEL
ncbi:hypothetical protein N9J72_00805 [Candidatus Gracilibacteria bacterium]|nr:hypothetical protein [Candidatus Gracilibacteria bacterium]